MVGGLAVSARTKRPFTRDADLAVAAARDREYTLRGSESRTLATVGAFRVVPARDLRDHADGPADPRDGDLRHLREQGLVETVRIPGYREQAVVLRRDERRSCSVAPLDPQAVRADLENRLREWRLLIQDRAAHGRRLLKQLIVGRLDLTPNLEERYYDFRGTGTLLPVITGAVPQSVASPPGFEPGFQP